MIYGILIFIIIILALSLFSFIWQIRNISRQIREKRNIRVSLSNKYIEELAGQINEKDALQKKLQIQIRQEEEQLKQSISDISHDLRTPLTSIQGYLTLLKESDHPAEQKQYIEIIQTKSDYLTSLVQEFYDLSLIEHDNFNIPIENVDINRIVTECIIDKYNEFKEIEPLIHIENAPVWIKGNLTACKRIIENLIVNALRYSDGTIELSLNSSGIFTIANSTTSLNEKDIDCLFQKFYTADKCLLHNRITQSCKAKTDIVASPFWT